MTDRRRERLESRRYSNLMDLPGVERTRDTPTSSRSSRANLWVEDEFSYQERRFVNDFKPFFLLCQLSGMFPNKLDWKLSFSWGYWATYFCLFYLFIMIVLLVFYISQVGTLYPNSFLLLNLNSFHHNRGGRMVRICNV